jgi:hypothetical protein
VHPTADLSRAVSLIPLPTLTRLHLQFFADGSDPPVISLLQVVVELSAGPPVQWFVRSDTLGDLAQELIILRDVLSQDLPRLLALQAEQIARQPSSSGASKREPGTAKTAPHSQAPNASKQGAALVAAPPAETFEQLSLFE